MYYLKIINVSNNTKLHFSLEVNQIKCALFFSLTYKPFFPIWLDTVYVGIERKLCSPLLDCPLQQTAITSKKKKKKRVRYLPLQANSSSFFLFLSATSWFSPSPTLSTLKWPPTVLFPLMSVPPPSPVCHFLLSVPLAAVFPLNGHCWHPSSARVLSNLSSPTCPQPGSLFPLFSPSHQAEIS